MNHGFPQQVIKEFIDYKRKVIKEFIESLSVAIKYNSGYNSFDK